MNATIRHILPLTGVTDIMRQEKPTVKVAGEPAEILFVNPDTGLVTLTYQGTTRQVPKQHLLMIIDKPTTQDEIVQLSELFYPSSSQPSQSPSGDFAPLTVGDLSGERGRKKSRGLTP